MKSVCAAESVLQPKGTRKRVRVGKIERHPKEKHPNRLDIINKKNK